MVSTRDITVFDSVGFANNNRIAEDSLLWLAAPVNVHDQALKTNAVWDPNFFKGVPERRLNRDPGCISERRCPAPKPKIDPAPPTADRFLEIASLGLKLLTRGGSGSQLNRSGADREVIGIPRLPAPSISNPPLASVRHRVLVVRRLGGTKENATKPRAL